MDRVARIALGQSSVTTGVSALPGQAAATAGQLGWWWVAALAVVCVAVAVALLWRRGKTRGVAARADVGAGKVRIANLHHIGKRESQQDSFGVSDLSNREQCDRDGVLAVVADGMGGISGGAEISALVVSSMLSAQRQGFSDNPEAPERLLRMVAAANAEAVRYIAKHNNTPGGSTVVAVLLSSNALHFISVGDSRICLLRQGALITLNREHTYGSRLDEQAARGEISVTEARDDPQRAALTSYIGLPELPQLDRSLKPVPLVSGDVVLLMSDGIFGTLSDAEIVSAFLNDGVYQAAVRLEQAVLAKQKASQDNFTAVLIARE